MSAERQVEDLPKELFSLFERIAEQVYERKEAEKATPTPTPDRDEELDVKELAAMEGVQPRTVYDWVREKRIPFHRTPGGRLRFYRRHVGRALSESPRP